MLRQIRSSDKLKKIFWIGLLILVIPSFILFYAGGSSGSIGNQNVANLATIEYPDGSEGVITRTEYMMARGFLQQNVAQAHHLDFTAAVGVIGQYPHEGVVSWYEILNND